MRARPLKLRGGSGQPGGHRVQFNLTYARGQRADDMLSVRNALGTQEYGEKAMALNYFYRSTQRP